jgi:peptidoglycan hydrolase-like protein with peptidoglycan-binding domain
MKNRKTGKWILVLVMMFLLNALCLTSVVYAKEINTHDSMVLASIKKGATGDSVAEIQKRLVELGYLTSADGSYGPGTEQAIKNFQAANGLGTDGVVNENTYNKMFSSEAKRYVAPTPTEVPEQSYTRAAAESPQERLVWITKTGKRYHSRSNCGSTKTAWQVTLEEAERKGLTRCGKCW